jgi:hypothetical protein
MGFFFAISRGTQMEESVLLMEAQLKDNDEGCLDDNP